MKRARCVGWCGLSLVGFLVAGCASSTTPKPAPSTTAATRSHLSHTPLELPFELREGRIFIQARVNGSEPHWFNLDSGAMNCSLGRSTAKGLKLERSGKITLHGIAGDKVEGLYRGVTFDLSGATLTPARVIIDDRDSGVQLGDDCLGYDVFDQFVVEIDYQAHLLRLYDPKTFRYAGTGEVIPIDCSHHQAVLETRLAGRGQAPVSARLLLDTGCNGAVCLAKPFVDEHKLVQAAGNTLPGTRQGIGGQIKTRIGRLGSLQLGQVRFEKPVAQFFQQASPAIGLNATQGHVGNEILRRFKVIFDTRHKHLILETNAAVAEPFLPMVPQPLLIAAGRDCVVMLHGAFLVGEGLDFERFTVAKIMEKSPAAEAGLRLKDVVIAVDDQPLANLTIQQALRLSRPDDRMHVLRVRRGSQTLELHVRSNWPL